MDPLLIARDLVAVNSINPNLVAGAPGEAGVAEVARDAMRRADLEVALQSVAPGRPNVIGVIESRTPGPSVMFCGHLDTVGVSGMTDPFAPRVEGGRLYGRGAQDMKGGVASMIAAAAILAQNWTRGRLVVAGVVDEEHMSIGAEALVREWRTDMAIVTEPTDLRVAVGHKGFAWAEVVTHGRAAHGSRPEEGRDAIARMGRVLVALEAVDAALRQRAPVEHQGTASLHASLIQGGHEISSYPDRCALQLERRTVSGEDSGTVQREIDAILEALKQQDPEFAADGRVVAYRPAYRLDVRHALPLAFATALEGRGLVAMPTGMSFWTDAAILGEAGIPSVLFGPGGAGLHSAVEYVNVADLTTCRDVLVEVVRSLTS